jgi:phospholipid-binding lipoprotein MlaA
MRTSCAQGATIVAFALLVAVSAHTGAARADATEPAPPAGAEGPAIEAPTAEPAIEPPTADELDPLFSDEFDDELEFGDGMESADPFESTNRKVFVFNRGVETVFIDPVTKGYRFVVPEVARKGIHRAFLNLNSPRTLVNDLLQLRFVDAAETLGRLVLNTTIGLGGLFDAGAAAGWERHESDFGQTLAVYGVDSGPYLVIPIFGPSTVRDGFGSIVDLAFQPLNYILGPTELLTHLYINSGRGLVTIDSVHDEMKALENSSVDYYAALRSAYLQSRRATIEGLDSPDEAIADYQRGDVSASPVQ